MTNTLKLRMNSNRQPTDSCDFSFDAFLFDMDGTLVDSTAVVERSWHRWAERHGLDGDAIIDAAHGVRSIDTIRTFAPVGVDVASENAWFRGIEIEDVDGIKPILGVPEFLDQIPTDRWAIVTSADRLLAERRLLASGIPMPHVLVTSDDVDKGKPDPEGFIRAAHQLRVDVRRCLVFEDSVPGIQAGRSACATVLTVGDVGRFDCNSTRLSISDFRSLRLVIMPDDTMAIEIK
ncbi:MAG: HAD-IA family hydrolase [Roseitalea sp.]|jgi:sugar-phosphatase|nr:HAD-IA family hydrolase [Roseitalea sp.]MBO6721137.1 HAD-IA family hydrolase [Roseitalea sp.]MBO6744195.1 HAD-IA family hydrolase [Roseitalea sp.]